MSLTIKRLRTNDEIAQLAGIDDPFILRDEGVEHGQMVQHYQTIPQQRRDDYLILAAYRDGKITAYLSASFTNVQPFAGKVWVLNARSTDPESSDLICAALKEWARGKGAKKIESYTRHEAAARAFERHGMKRVGIVLEMEV